jgi:hypothetical protein
MENDSPNQTTKRLLIHISEAAKFTDPYFTITACNPAALALLLYNQQNIPGPSSFLVSPSAKTNSHLSLVMKVLVAKKKISQNRTLKQMLILFCMHWRRN